MSAFGSSAVSSVDGAIVPEVLGAIDDLFAVDSQLLAFDASERAICGALARHLAVHFPDHHVDVEYNRIGEQNLKRLSLIVDSDLKECSVFPDIIVHNRSRAENLVVIEVKKRRNTSLASYRRAVDFDLQKLTAYRLQLGYNFAYFLELPTGAAAQRDGVTIIAR